MRIPPGYAMERVLSPGPLVCVWEARGPQGVACVVKSAMSNAVIDALGREASILRGLARAKVADAPRVVGDGGHWIAVERVAMPTLDALGESMRGDAELRARVARDAFAHLAAVHRARDEVGALDVVHGDVAPGNVLADGTRAVLVDYGLARWRSDAPPADRALRGTLATMAPEVARGERATPRSDDFAMAASILLVATGAPLRAETKSKAALVAEAAEARFDASHPWATRAPELFPKPIAEALLACLAFEPKQRPPQTPAL